MEQYAIQYREDSGHWRDWFVATDPANAEREWRHLTAVQPQRQLRLVKVEKATERSATSS